MENVLYSRFWLPENLARGREAVDWLLATQHLLIVAAFLAWLGFFGFCLVRYRASRKAPVPTKSPRWPFAVDAVLLLCELALLFGVSVPVWARWRQEAYALPTDFAVRVVAQQYAWNVHYPGPDGVFGATSPEKIDEGNPIGLDRASEGAADDVIAVNELHIPIDTPVRARLSSLDVVHGFSLPVLRVKQDVIPGMETAVRFEAIRKGTYDIACAQLCGLGHYRMRGALVVESREDFEKWLRGMQ